MKLAHVVRIEGQRIREKVRRKKDLAVPIKNGSHIYVTEKI
jgi:hypothetical protein